MEKLYRRHYAASALLFAYCYSSGPAAVMLDQKLTIPALAESYAELALSAILYYSFFLLIASDQFFAGLSSSNLIERAHEEIILL